MINRIAFISAAALVLATSSAGAQGQSQKPVVVSKTVLKSMGANKPKSKTQLGAKAGIVRRKSVVASKPANAQPTSVREIPKKN